MTWPCPASGWTGPVRTFCSPCSSAWWPCTWSRRWPKPRENGRALQVLFPVGAVLWTFLFQTQLGILVVLAMTAMYFLRERPLWRDILVAVLGLATIPASLSVLLIHFHRPGPSMFPKWIYYAAYPIQLLAIGLIGYFLL